MSRKLVHDEHFVLDGNRIHVAAESENDFEVWLNTDVGDYDGLCIGCGRSREEAIADAVTVLDQGLRALRASASGD